MLPNANYFTYTTFFRNAAYAIIAASPIYRAASLSAVVSRRVPIQSAMRSRGVFLFVITQFQLFIFFLERHHLFLVAVEL